MNIRLREIILDNFQSVTHGVIKCTEDMTGVYGHNAQIVIDAVKMLKNIVANNVDGIEDACRVEYVFVMNEEQIIRYTVSSSDNDVVLECRCGKYHFNAKTPVHKRNAALLEDCGFINEYIASIEILEGNGEMERILDTLNRAFQNDSLCLITNMDASLSEILFVDILRAFFELKDGSLIFTANNLAPLEVFAYTHFVFATMDDENKFIRICPKGNTNLRKEYIRSCKLNTRNGICLANEKDAHSLKMWFYTNN